MATERSDENLVRVKADATGVDVSIGKNLPDLVARLLPSRFRARRSVNDAITTRLVAKIRSDELFDDAELAFAEAILDDQASKYLRLKQIQSRAYSLFEESPITRLIETEHAEKQLTGETSEDWVNKFREDASLVDDELIREIYARVLKEEAECPTSFSLRTLGVLRYLDRDAATAFGLLQKVLIDGTCVPIQTPAANDILNSLGLDHATMLMLDDAGLINARTHSNYKKQGDIVIFNLSGHKRVVALRRNDREQLSISLSVHLLTPAGKQLGQIAECESDERAMNELTKWLGSHVTNAEVLLAKSTSRNWSGLFGDLEWHRIDAR